jgi:two-component system sensor histidine kinase DctS
MPTAASALHASQRPALDGAPSALDGASPALDNAPPPRRDKVRAAVLDDVPPPAPEGAPPAALDQVLPPATRQALAAFGDVVALVHRASATLRWTSPAWRALLPTAEAGTPLAALDPALPTLLAADETAPQRLLLGEAGAWDVQRAPHDAGHRLLRLSDRREQGRALQRQLDDREQLLFTSRVISVGEMASTLAHELNQPIGAAANLLRGLRARLSRRPRATGAAAAAAQAEEADALARAIEQVMFASRVIARIREFTHSHQPRHVRVDLGALVRACASLLDWDLRRSGAALQLDLPKAPVRVRGDEVMLQQVVVNLMRNALDAMRSDPPAEARLILRLRANGREAELQVRDNGCGLAEDAAAKLFVPFASSKPNGMGIGLSICRSFVELHQGRLWFSRNADRGATFHLGLPLMSDLTEPAPGA